MVGGGDRIIEWTAETVKGMLTDYKRRKMENRLLKKKDNEMLFLDRCLSLCERNEKEVLTKMYIEAVPLHKLEQKYGTSRYLLKKNTDRVLENIAVLFTEHYQ